MWSPISLFMDTIFKALNDVTRRQILDRLRLKDGQTLQELEANLAMTRFGVMKHLKVLEDAQLVVSRKSGRFKYHYLNAVPLQEVIDRWIEPLLAKPAARGLLDLKAKLEGTAMPKPDFVTSIYIRCTADALWDALREADQVTRYELSGLKVERRGAALCHLGPDGSTRLTMTELEADPKSRLVVSFEMAQAAEVGRVVYHIDEKPDACRLTVEHFGIGGAFVALATDGWHRTLSGLKTMLETGQPVHFAAQIAMPA